MEPREAHWQKVFAEKAPDQVSWYQEIPQVSLRLVNECAAELRTTQPNPLAIIDIGAGDSHLVDHLLEPPGVFQPTVLDISANALTRAQARLGTRAQAVEWVASNVLDFKPQPHSYHIWHDRAAFHFLTDPEDQAQYAQLAAQAVAPGGYLILGAFAAETGPEKCSGLPVCRHDETSLQRIFGIDFWRLHCVQEAHLTPFGTTQDFVFCVFRRAG